MRTAIVTVICLLFFPIATLGQQPAVREITIESGRSGLGPSDNLKLVIQSRGGKSYFGDEVIDSKRIEVLLAALRSPVLPAPEGSNLGITREWLRQSAHTFPRNGAPNQQALFEQSFSDLRTIDQLLPFCFKFLMFDDYPNIRVTVAFTNGQRWVAASDSYYPFMLPWRLKLKEQEHASFNADISRAIAALMPTGSLNRNRLNDEELKDAASRGRDDIRQGPVGSFGCRESRS